MSAVHLTAAGRAAVADGANHALRAIQITSIQIGSGAKPAEGTDDDSRVALRARQATSPAAGSTTTPGRLAILADFAAPAAGYAIREVGVFARIGAGAEFLFAYRAVTAAATAIGQTAPGATTTVAVVIEVTQSAAQIAVTISPSIALSFSGSTLLYAAETVLSDGVETDIALTADVDDFRWLICHVRWSAAGLPPRYEYGHVRVAVSRLDDVSAPVNENGVLWMFGAMSTDEHGVYLLRDIDHGDPALLYTIPNQGAGGLASTGTALYRLLGGNIFPISAAGVMGSAVPIGRIIRSGGGEGLAYHNGALYTIEHRQTLGSPRPDVLAKITVPGWIVTNPGSPPPGIDAASLTSSYDGAMMASGGNLYLAGRLSSTTQLLRIDPATGTGARLGRLHTASTNWEISRGEGVFMVPPMGARGAILGASLTAGARTVEGLWTINLTDGAVTLLREMTLPLHTPGAGAAYHPYTYQSVSPSYVITPDRSLHLHREGRSARQLKASAAGLQFTLLSIAAET